MTESKLDIEKELAWAIGHWKEGQTSFEESIAKLEQLLILRPNDKENIEPNIEEDKISLEVVNRTLDLLTAIRDREKQSLRLEGISREEGKEMQRMIEGWWDVFTMESAGKPTKVRLADKFFSAMQKAVGDGEK